MLKNPVERQALPPPPPSLLEKQFWNGVLGAVGMCSVCQQRRGSVIWMTPA